VKKDCYGNGLCFEKPSFILSSETNFHFEDCSVSHGINGWNIMTGLLPKEIKLFLSVC
jgi:hypothetical protein